MSEFKHGQRVKVSIPEFYGKVLYVHGDDFSGVDVLPEGEWSMDGYSLDGIPAEYVTPAPQDPESWPPQVGDVWETEDGSDWFGRRHIFEKGLVVLTGEDGRSVDVDEFKRLNPRLVRRRGQ